MWQVDEADFRCITETFFSECASGPLQSLGEKSLYGGMSSVIMNTSSISEVLTAFNRVVFETSTIVPSPNRDT